MSQKREIVLEETISFDQVEQLDQIERQVEIPIENSEISQKFENQDENITNLQNEEQEVSARPFFAFLSFTWLFFIVITVILFFVGLAIDQYAGPWIAVIFFMYGLPFAIVLSLIGVLGWIYLANKELRR